MIKRLLLPTVIVVLGLASCTKDKHSTCMLEEGIPHHADSVIQVVGDTRNVPLILSTIDSLEQEGELSKVRVIFYKTVAYNLREEYRTSFALYEQLDNINVKKLTDLCDVECYVYSYNNYVRLLCEMKRYDEALNVAFTVDKKLKAVGHNSFIDHHDIAQIIGNCQLNLGQTQKAAASYQRALQGIHNRLSIHSDPLDYRECQKTMNAIARIYIEKALYNEAAPWIQRQDSLYLLADKHPHRDSVFQDEMKAEICYCKALLAHAQGRNDEAEKAYNDYLSTQTSKVTGNIINNNEYLLQTQRYSEAADNYRLLDQYMLEGNLENDLENIGRYYIPKFQANMLAGRTDSALNIANRVAQIYDSALNQQKLSLAAEVAAVYDIQGKERQIAEQRSKLYQMRLVAIAVCLFLIVISFGVIIINHRNHLKKLKQEHRKLEDAYDKLDTTNHQLIEANKRAEESARMKTNFIQQISHEIRTPLNILTGFTQVLASPNIELSSENLQEAKKKIEENSKRITDLIDKMLDLSDASSEIGNCCEDDVMPIDIATQAVEKCGIKEATHLDFNIQLSQQAEVQHITTNKEYAVKALTLILDNARKFTRPAEATGMSVGKIKQRVTLQIEVVNQQICFIVEDTGIGVPPEEATHIFTEFVQLNEYYDGTGIGLSIARSLARSMHGDVMLDTTYTGGARFVLTLPVNQ
ncbi:MAG: hypothetical protein K6D91_00310 [Prevotella sp.]|nr:hypothetical protein [Prevotella sp.]